MCGGVIFPYSAEYKKLLEQVYSPEDVARFEAEGQVRSVYWQKAEPVLPVIEEGDGEGGQEQAPKLLRWGNRDKEAPFPQTGWARLESIEAGKWRHMKPRAAMIPVSYGVEKGNWFTIKNGIAGLVVQKDGEDRVYMLTREADPEFYEVTHHDRKPVLIEQEEFPWLPAEPGKK
jgi:hypothetical protein